MAGMDLIFSLICLNSTCLYDNDLVYTDALHVKRFRELRAELAGRHLTIATLQNAPLNYAEKDEDDKWVGKGIAFNLVNFLRDKYNFTYDVVLPKQNFVGTAEYSKDSVVGLLLNDSVDFAAAFLPVLSTNREHIRYSQNLDEGEWLILMKRPPISAGGSGLLAPFDETVWMLILLSVIAVGPCIYLLILIRHRLSRNKEDEDQPYPLPECVWFVYGALVKQGSTLSPVADSTRLLFATWWIFITVLTSFYTANLTAFLTLSKFTLPITEPGDLLSKNYRWVARKGSAVEYVVQNEKEKLNYLYKMILNNRAYFDNDIDDSNILTKVAKGDYVFVRDRPAVEHLMFKDYKTKAHLDEDKRCTFVVTTTTFMKKGRAFAYPAKSTLRDLFDPVLLSLVESGIVKHMMRNDLPNTEICPMDLGSTERKLRNGDLMMTYQVVITGFVVAVVSFLGEVFVRNCKTTSILRFTSARLHGSGSHDPQKFKQKSALTPPPAYGTLFQNRTVQDKKFPDRKKQIINGREYYVFRTPAGESRLVPVRTPSALLFQHSNY